MSPCPPPTLGLAEPLMERALLLRTVQGHEPHAVHRVRAAGARKHDGHLADHAEHDRGCHLLRHVHWPRHRPHPVAGLLKAPVPGEGLRGEELPRVWGSPHIPPAPCIVLRMEARGVEGMGTSKGSVAVIKTEHPPALVGGAAHRTVRKLRALRKKSRGDTGADEGERTGPGDPLVRGVSGLSQEGWGCWGCSRTQGRPLGSKDVLGLGLPGASPTWPHRPALPGGQLQSFASVSPPSGQGWPSSPNPAPLSLYCYPRAGLGPAAAAPPAVAQQSGRPGQLGLVPGAPAVRKPPASHPNTSWCRHPPAVTGSAELRTAVAGRG